MKAIIIEDEKLSADHLANLLKKCDPQTEIVARFDSVKKSVESFQKGIQADVLFLDVHLADGLSFEIFSIVQPNMPIIFTTAYDEYALKAFKVNSIDYLLKPIGLNDLSMAVEKFKKVQISAQQTLIENLNLAYQQLSKSYKNRFIVKIGDSISSVRCEDISHFLSEDGAVLLLTGSKRYVIDFTLDAIESLVSPQLFFRINRKVILNISSIQKVSPYYNSRLKVVSENLSDEESVVSRERVNDFKNWLDH